MVGDFQIHNVRKISFPFSFSRKRIRPEQIQWPKESQKYPLTVFNQPHSKDILQGRLGNCWFASALSLVAGIPQVLHHVMITKQYNPTGQ